MALPSTRNSYLLILLSTIGLMAYALYTQYVDGLVPCPLCMTQRIFYCLIGALALMAFLHNRRSAIYSSLITLAAIAGSFAAGRQVWMQHLPPDQVPACGPSLEYMLETFPFAEALKMLITGNGNCADIQWQFVGLSMPEWSLICLVGLAVTGIWQACRKT